MQPNNFFMENTEKKIDTIPEVTAEEVIIAVYQYANSFAIDFVEWKDKLYVNEKCGLFDSGIGIYDDGKVLNSLTTLELLEIFKSTLV